MISVLRPAGNPIPYLRGGTQAHAEAVAELLNGFNKGQNLILLEAVRQLGGERRLH
jgi:hypothetical protein